MHEKAEVVSNAEGRTLEVERNDPRGKNEPYRRDFAESSLETISKKADSFPSPAPGRS
jgi:hypothetical protein